MKKLPTEAMEQVFRMEALFLAKTYGWMLGEKERLTNLLQGSWIYTRDMAIQDLSNISVSYDGEHVQSSNISNTTEKIALKIMEPGYMERKQEQMNGAKILCEADLAYIVWKLGIVETTMRERMDKKERGIFKKYFGSGWTFKKMRDNYKRNLYNWQIADSKARAIGHLEEQIAVVHCFENENKFLDKLTREAERYFATEEENTDRSEEIEEEENNEQNDAN